MRDVLMAGYPPRWTRGLVFEEFWWRGFPGRPGFRRGRRLRSGGTDRAAPGRRLIRSRSCRVPSDPLGVPVQQRDRGQVPDDGFPDGHARSQGDRGVPQTAFGAVLRSQGQQELAVAVVSVPMLSQSEGFRMMPVAVTPCTSSSPMARRSVRSLFVVNGVCRTPVVFRMPDTVEPPSAMPPLRMKSAMASSTP